MSQTPCARPRQRSSSGSTSESTSSLLERDQEPKADARDAAGFARAAKLPESLRSRLCPGVGGEVGAVVIGVVVGQGLAHIRPAVAIGPELGDRRGSEARLRFAQPCARGECRHFGRDASHLPGRLEGSPSSRRARSEGDVSGLPARGSAHAAFVQASEILGGRAHE